MKSDSIYVQLVFFCRYTDYIDFKSELPQQSVPPFCAADLPFSMITMEHLEGLVKRDQLMNYAEKELGRHIFAEYQFENIGHRIKYSLDKVHVRVSCAPFTIYRLFI
jgi:hypothetical protein